jgi:thioredoxin 1
MTLEEFDLIINSKKPVLVDYFATWCGPCRMMEPILEQVKVKMGESVTILKIDVDQEKELTQKYSIRGVPTLILYKEGEIKWRQSGVMMSEVIEGKINEFM